MKDVRELSVSDASLEPAARSARSAAFATAAACIAATQEKEGLFANPLKPPGKSADPAGGTSVPPRSASPPVKLYTSFVQLHVDCMTRYCARLLGGCHPEECAS
jgi:hypothetical protein